MKLIYRLPFKKVLVIGWTNYINMTGKIFRRKFFAQIKDQDTSLECW